MKLIFLIFMIILRTSFGENDHKKSVHFKIHVPEIIKHHIHTKTIFIHVHEMKPHNNEKHNEENHAEDWTSYDTYNYNNGLHENHSGIYNIKKQKNMVTSYGDYLPVREDDYQPFKSLYIYNSPDNSLANKPSIYNGSPVTVFDPSIDSKDIIDNGLPSDDIKTHELSSQYEIHENMDEDIPNNDIDYRKINEKGYRHGMKTESGHVIHKNLKNFYDKENEEDTSSNIAFENENYNKYDTSGYHGKYDKEIGFEQRAGKKLLDRRFIIARMLIS